MSRAISAFLDRQLLIGLGVAIAASIVIAPLVARRLRITRAAAYLGVLSAMSVLSFTVFARVEGLTVGFDVRQAFTWWTTQRASVIDVALSERGWSLNVALFVPTGLIWSAITQRPLAVAVALAGSSFAIESLQGLTGLGASDISDLAANTLGGVIGALLIALVLKFSPRLIPNTRLHDTGVDVDDDLRFDPAWVAGALLVTALAVGLGFAGVQAVLSSRQAALRSELEEVFSDMTIDEADEIRLRDPINGSDFFELTSVFPDSYQFREDGRPVEVRYPVDFLGAYRCVFVTLSDAPPVFVNGSGRECVRDRYDENGRISEDS